MLSASLSKGFSRQESWSGLPFPSPGSLPDPGIEPRSPALQADSLPFDLPEEFSDKGSRNWEYVPEVISISFKVTTSREIVHLFKVWWWFSC